MHDSSSSDHWPSRRATRRALRFGVPLTVLLGAAFAWASVTLKTWNDGDTLTAADLNGNFAALNAAVPKSVYRVWGRTACGGSDVVIHTGFLAAWGGGTGQPNGGPMCLDEMLALTSWSAHNAALVSRASVVDAGLSDASGHRAQFLQSGNLACAVCKGSSYVQWGRTTCGAGDSIIYQGHIAALSYNGGNGADYSAGPVCVDDADSGLTWADWGSNGTLTRAAGASPDGGVEGGPVSSQYLEARDGPCVVCQ
jgi:hypothetical protein